MNKKSSSPTMKDVALEAGVAVGTVSKVVNGIPVGMDYQEKVEAAIKKLGYKINTYAQGLKANKTNTIALIIPNTVNQFFGELAYAISRTLSKKGYQMLLWCTDDDSDEGDVYDEFYIDQAARSRVDGIICLTYHQNLRIDSQIPLVTIDKHLNPGIPCVTSDNFGGGQMAASKLVELGCKNIAFLGIGSPLSNEPAKRADGFRSGCEALGVQYEVFNVQDGTNYIAFKEFLLQHYHEGKLDLDGIFCNTDTLAKVVMHYLEILQVRVPQDVQVIGFDGMKDTATQMLTCSTIVQNIKAMARLAVDTVLLLQEEDKQVPASLMCVPVTYAQAKTTKDSRK